MADASSSSTWPNPLRTPLIIAAAIATFVGYVVWVGGTGGIDPSLLDAEEEVPSAWWTIEWLLYYSADSPGMLLLLAVSLITAAGRAGWRDMNAGLRFALGSGDPRRMAGAARFWATAARVAAWGAVVFALAGTVAAEILIYRGERLGDDQGLLDPGDIWVFCTSALFVPIAGILFGRIVFGLLAGGARLRAAEPRSEPVFSRVQDVALAALVAVPWYHLMLMTWSPSP